MANLRSVRGLRRLAFVCALGLLITACVMSSSDRAKQHMWWSGLGPVLPHESFPGDCALCHVGEDWQTLTADFRFDHQAETGVPLRGAHAQATCLRCHNDRGPVAVFARRGCAGCHEDVHQGGLGTSCETCHQEQSWRPSDQIARHDHSRFPLMGVHAATACHRCHLGAEVGIFQPTSPDCVSCHARDLANATNPNHAGLGWVDRCDRCHLPRTWQHAEIND